MLIKVCDKNLIIASSQPSRHNILHNDPVAAYIAVHHNR